MEKNYILMHTLTNMEIGTLVCMGFRAVKHIMTL